MEFPKHPFPVTTVFTHCLLVNFRVDPDRLARALPAPLVPALEAGHAWLSVVIAQLRHMRPVGVPAPLGVSYNQVVYRAVVQCGPHRGVHFLRSDADSTLMTGLGNLMSFFRFHRADISIAAGRDAIEVAVTSPDGSGDLAVRAELSAATARLPVGSVLPGLAGAKRTLVELFTAYTADSGGRVAAVDIDRNDWNIAVVPSNGSFRFMSAGPVFGPGDAELDSIFVVDDLRYRWHRLRHLPRSGT